MKPTEKTEIVGNASCPNCNARADVIARKRGPKTPWWEIVCRCPKCKGEWPYVERQTLDFGDFVVEANVGPMMHDVQKRTVDANRALMEQWKKADTPAKRGRIMQAVRKLAEEEKEWIMSL